MRVLLSSPERKEATAMLAGTVTELREMNALASKYALLNRFRHNGEKSAVTLFNADAGLRQRGGSDTSTWLLTSWSMKAGRSTHKRL